MLIFIQLLVNFIHLFLKLILYYLEVVKNLINLFYGLKL
jgi:hypothetical protein